jgi:peroxiredoxin
MALDQEPSGHSTSAPPPAKPVTLIVLALSVGITIGALLLGSLVRNPKAIPAAGTGQDSLIVGNGLAAQVGGTAPDFTLETLDGEQVTLSHFRGQPVVMNFWASWCGPCRAEMPELVRIYEEKQAAGLVILAINLTHTDSIPAVEAFVDEFRLPFPVLLDDKGVVTDLYVLRGLPMSVFIDREGMIQHIQIGLMSGEQVDTFVGEILDDIP